MEKPTFIIYNSNLYLFPQMDKNFNKVKWLVSMGRRHQRKHLMCLII